MGVTGGRPPTLGAPGPMAAHPRSLFPVVPTADDSVEATSGDRAARRAQVDQAGQGAPLTTPRPARMLPCRIDFGIENSEEQRTDCSDSRCTQRARLVRAFTPVVPAADDVSKPSVRSRGRLVTGAQKSTRLARTPRSQPIARRGCSLRRIDFWDREFGGGLVERHGCSTDASTARPRVAPSGIAERRLSLDVRGTYKPTGHS